MNHMAWICWREHLIKSQTSHFSTESIERIHSQCRDARRYGCEDTFSSCYSLRPNLDGRRNTKKCWNKPTFDPRPVAATTPWKANDALESQRRHHEEQPRRLVLVCSFEFLLLLPRWRLVGFFFLLAILLLPLDCPATRLFVLFPCKDEEQVGECLTVTRTVRGIEQCWLWWIDFGMVWVVSPFLFEVFVLSCGKVPNFPFVAMRFYEENAKESHLGKMPNVVFGVSFIFFVVPRGAFLFVARVDFSESSQKSWHLKGHLSQNTTDTIRRQCFQQKT